MTRHPSRDRLERALARIADPKGEGARTCLTVYAAVARAAADAADARARAGLSLGPIDGRVVAVKDLFDLPAKRRAPVDRPCATHPRSADATIIRRLRPAGAVIVAKTNMTSSPLRVGINPHYGTPGNPADRLACRRFVIGRGGRGRRRHGEVAIGSDTGGSAAFLRLCGLVGSSRASPGTDRGRVPAVLHARFDRSAGASARIAPRPTP